MLPIERRKEILNIILKEGSVKADALAQKYQVGVPTIRRDLKFLAKEHGVLLMYGGAYVNRDEKSQNVQEINLIQKKLSHIEEKRLIAQKAAALIDDGDTIALNAGSTVELILDYIKSEKKINLITLSINVAIKASIMPNVTVYVPGGKLRSISGAFVGSYADDFLTQFNVDKAFLGVSAISLKKGVTHTSLEEISTNQTLADISDRCFLVSDYSKFDRVSMVNMFELDIFECFITDGKIPDHYREYAQNNDIEII